MSYQSALFCQFFAEELAQPGSHQSRIVRALKRLSPTLVGKELRIYANSILDTITVNGSELRPDWRKRVEEEH